MRLWCGLILVYCLFCAGSHADDDFSKCFDFLMQNAPARDYYTLIPSYINSTINYALSARYSSDWASEVPWDIFTEWVLPYAVVDEPRDNWRPLFYKLLMPLVEKATSITDAFYTINSEIWTMWGIIFQSNSTPDVMSPFETMSYGYASCTGWAIMLVDALRAVGVPSRMTGTPCWNTADGGNHDWVEIWFNNSWSFVEPGSNSINSTWWYPYPVQYAIPGYEHGVFTATHRYQPNNIHFPMTWAPNDISVHGIDVTTYYTEKQ
ncbi:transglutaminase domain protein [Pelomyxa schiedti]|nr:transglutaminase domain protein [Pelomyxa schiedti]